MIFVIIVLLLSATAIATLMVLSFILKRDVEDIEARLDRLEDQPTEDPFEDLDPQDMIAHLPQRVRDRYRK